MSPAPTAAADIRAAAVTLAAGPLLAGADRQPGDRVVVGATDPRLELIGALAMLHGSGDVDVAVLDPRWPEPVRRAAIDRCGATLVLDLDGSGTSRRIRAAGPARGTGWIAFTSGSTGPPRPVRRTLESWTSSYAAFDALTGIGPGDRVLIPGSLASSMCAFAALHAVSRGAELVLLPRWNPAGAAGVDVVHVVPTMLGDLLRTTAPGCPPRLVISAGATLGPGLVDAVTERWPFARLLEYYGSSEQSFVSVRTDGPATTVGVAFPGVQVGIGDPADPSPPGTPGEIWVRSPYTAESALDGLRTLAVDVDGWVSVGDHGYLDDAGRLTLLGRGRIVCGGVVVEPGAVEAVLRAAGAGDAVVLGLPHPRLGEVVCAVVDGGPGLPTLRAHVRSALRAAERPRVWFAASPLPRTPAGKPDRGGLQAAAAAGLLPALR